nr:hypothetical protein [Mycolicibacterium malmesburyense]
MGAETTETGAATTTDGNDAPGETSTSGPAGEEGQPGAPAAPGEPGQPGAPAAPGAAPDSMTIATPGGEFVVQGVILQKYNEAGGPESPLGMPTTSEEAAPNGGRFNTFDGGAIYWTPETGAHIVWGGIREAWEGDGGAGGQLGYPTSDEQTVPGGWQQEFQHGTVAFIDGQPQTQMR